MKLDKILLSIAQMGIDEIREEMERREARIMQQKRSEKLRKGSIDVEFRVIKE